IQSITNKGLVSGEDGYFRPQRSITRAEAASILNKYLQYKNRFHGNFTKNKFSDVKPGNWYYQAVINVSNMGVVNGDKRGKFNPKSELTRAELAAMVVNMEKYVKKADYLFHDVSKRMWYAEA